MVKNPGKKEIIDMGWGNPYFLLEVLDKMYTPKLSPNNVKEMSYAPDRGMDRLRELTREAIKTTTGLDYKHIVITNGATHAINTILRMYGKDRLYTNPLGYPYYPDMIRRAGYERKETQYLPKKGDDKDGLCLIDSPSNPMGIQVGSDAGDKDTAIWDAVYHNRIYTEDLSKYPQHNTMVGSYSKLLGLTGARVGWIATNNIFTAMFATDWALKDNATISVPSQELIIDILEKIDLEKFIEVGKRYIDSNREEFQKIEYLFDGQPVQKTGMFYCAKADEKVFELFDKCGINYVRLGKNTMRLSMGQTHSVIREGIRRLLQEDKIK